MNGKLEELGEKAQKKAIKLKVQGLSHSAIADELNKEFEASLTTLNVQNFLKRKRTQTFQLAREDKNFRSKMAQQYWDTIQQLKDLNTELISFFYDLKKNPDFMFKKTKCPECDELITIRIPNHQTILKTADVILRQIKHADETIKKAQENNLNIQVNLVDATQKIVKIMPTIFDIAEKKGIIKKYNKKRLKQFQNS